jgi:hypothetical protein
MPDQRLNRKPGGVQTRPSACHISTLQFGTTASNTNLSTLNCGVDCRSRWVASALPRPMNAQTDSQSASGANVATELRAGVPLLASTAPAKMIMIKAGTIAVVKAMVSYKLEHMANDSENESQSALLAEAQLYLEEIRQFRMQAEEQFKAAEIARKSADSEGLFAFNAKRACEMHSTAISQLKGTAEAEVNSIVTNRQKVDELSSLIVAGKPIVEANLAGIAESQKVIAENEKTIEQATGAFQEETQKALTLIQEIAASKKSAEGLARETEQTRDAANEALDKAKTAQSKTEGCSEEAEALVGKITDTHVLGTQYYEKIDAILTLAKADKETIAAIIDHLKSSNEIATGFETRVTQSSKDLESLIKKAAGLLPGFTSVSLASAFGNHKLRFRNPKIAWMATFVFCIVCLVAVSLPSFLAAISDKAVTKTWEEILRVFAMRLPIVIPLVWLGIYAGKNYMLSIRLEEDYAYKEAISIAFEGYKREMKEIAAEDAQNPTPMTKLCANVLAAIAERPGRIYEGKHQNFTLMTEAHGALEKVDELRKKAVATE